jgi:transcriptional regulator with XRE-family HTH domain
VGAREYIDSDITDGVNTDTVGRTVRWARTRAGMTQQELAEATGMPQPSIARIEAGAVVPRTATLIALLEATGHQLSVVPIDPATDREDGL